MPPPMAPADIMPSVIWVGNTSASAGQIDDAEPADEIAVGDADEALHGHVQHVGGGEGEDGGHDRPGQHHLPAFCGSHCRAM